MDNSETLAHWLVRGKTVLIPKDGCTGRTDQFRPIACLNTSYKLLTGALAATLTEYVIGSGILPAEQKALRKGARGCLVVLTIDAAVTEEARKDKRDLSVAWVDYRKAYDLVPPPPPMGKCCAEGNKDAETNQGPGERGNETVGHRPVHRDGRGTQAHPHSNEEGYLSRGFLIPAALLSMYSPAVRGGKKDERISLHPPKRPSNPLDVHG